MIWTVLALFAIASLVVSLVVVFSLVCVASRSDELSEEVFSDFDESSAQSMDIDLQSVAPSNSSNFGVAKADERKTPGLLDLDPFSPGSRGWIRGVE